MDSRCVQETRVDFRRNGILKEAIQALGMRSLWLIKAGVHKVDALQLLGEKDRESFLETV